MSDTWQSEVTAFGADAIVQEQMPSVYTDLDAVTAESYDSVSRHG
jgi:hypothetical protein